MMVGGFVRGIVGKNGPMRVTQVTTKLTWELLLHCDNRGYVHLVRQEG